MRNIFLFIRRYFVFICFIILQVLCIIMLSNSGDTHNAFFSLAANEVVGKVNTRYNSFSSYFNLKETNKQLAQENARLRNMLAANFQAPDTSKIIVTDTLIRDTANRVRKYTYLPANVVGNNISGQNNFLTLERGSAQGIVKDMAVVGPQGIVGVVVETSKNYSTVMSLLNRKGRVSAMLKKDKSAGSIEWDGKDPNYVTLKNISKGSKVVKGDTVLTSTYSANFPSHIMIGTVEAITPEPSSNNYILKIKTATNFHTIQFVDVILNARFAEQSLLEKIPAKTNE